MIWTDPPLDMRTGTQSMPYTVAFIASYDHREERCGTFKFPNLDSARKQCESIFEAGDMCRIYNIDGNPVS